MYVCVRVPDPLELELQLWAAMWGWELSLGSFERVASALNHWAIIPAPEEKVFIHLVFQDRASLCSPDCPETHSVDQVDLEFRNHLPLSFWFSWGTTQNQNRKVNKGRDSCLYSTMQSNIFQWLKINIYKIERYMLCSCTMVHLLPVTYLSALS